MLNFLKRCCSSKRECITYLVIFLWIFIGSLAIYFESNLTDLAAYFISLTGFVASYIFGESVRKSTRSSLFVKGLNSKRESMIYVVILLWTTVGTWTIIKHGDLVGVSAYFAALTPFVGSYIIGQTYKKDSSEDLGEQDQIIHS